MKRLKTFIGKLCVPQVSLLNSLLIVLLGFFLGQWYECEKLPRDYEAEINAVMFDGKCDPSDEVLIIRQWQKELIRQASLHKWIVLHEYPKGKFTKLTPDDTEKFYYKETPWFGFKQ